MKSCPSPSAVHIAIPRWPPQSIKAALIRHLDDLEKLPTDKLRAQRNQRINGFGVYSEAAN